MKILFVAAEVAPFVSVGGLSQVTYFLPRALAEKGHDVRIFTAKYGKMDEDPKKKWNLKMEAEHLRVPFDSDIKESFICNVKSYQDRKSSVKTYFLENREYYELRANVYGYKDDHVRFALLSKGVLEWLLESRGMDKSWWPDAIHAHDWHTGYLIDLAKRNKRYKSTFEKTPFLFTVHNFHLQGNYDFRFCPKENFDDGSSQLKSIHDPKQQTQNPLKRGILYADAVNTVSPTHAVEVLRPEYSRGLGDVIRLARGKITGILNGLDYGDFSPSKDKKIRKRFDEHNFIDARHENKKDLQKLFGLPQGSKRPVLAFSGRLVEQKGIDFILDVLPHLLLERPDVQVVILGSGDDRYRLELSVLQKKFPDQIGLHLRSDFKLPRKIFAGADIMLIPSHFEPGGIIALEALRFGCVPIVRRTGGLNDVIEDFDPGSKAGNGFSFINRDPWALYGAIIEALTIYKNNRMWNVVVRNCMMSDFSWEYSAGEYDKWYKNIIERKKNG